MARLRFETVRDLFEGYPTAEQDLDQEPTDEPSLNYLARLRSEGEISKAVLVLAYLLPRREAVWWACQSLRAFGGKRTPQEEQALTAAEAWVEHPEEENRLQVLQNGVEGRRKSATTWVALAAGWAGGQAIPGMPFPPYQTARAAATAVNTAWSKSDPAVRDAELAKCMESGTKMIESDA